MRIIVFGVGAVGGAMAAGLALAGHDVVGIARGAQLDAIREKGLALRSHRGVEVVRFDCVASPDQIDWRPDDAVLLTMKGQDTEAALRQLQAAGVREQPIFCAQNGVANERAALRLFPNVHGITVMLPVDFLVPGEVVAWCGPKLGMFDIGRYPSGVDAADRALAEALTSEHFSGFVSETVMESKYGKLLMNLKNIVGASMGEGPVTSPVGKALRAEGESVLAAAGIPWVDVGAGDPRRKDLMRMMPLEGVERAGSSTAQSFMRNVGSVETDYLNGEIALLGRLYGVPVPANSWVCDLAQQMLREGLEPGSVDPVEALAALGIAG